MRIAVEKTLCRDEAFGLYDSVGKSHPSYRTTGLIPPGQGPCSVQADFLGADGRKNRPELSKGRRGPGLAALSAMTAAVVITVRMASR